VNKPGSTPPGSLAQVDAKLGDLLESTPDAIVMVDALGVIVLVNSLAEQLFRYDRDELLGQSVEALLPASFRHQHVAHRAGYFKLPHTRTMGARDAGDERRARHQRAPAGREEVCPAAGVGA
jgi:PAS domain S-box-containing protein